MILIFAPWSFDLAHSVRVLQVFTPLTPWLFIFKRGHDGIGSLEDRAHLDLPLTVSRVARSHPAVSRQVTVLTLRSQTPITHVPTFSSNIYDFDNLCLVSLCERNLIRADRVGSPKRSLSWSGPLLEFHTHTTVFPSQITQRRHISPRDTTTCRPLCIKLREHLWNFCTQTKLVHLSFSQELCCAKKETHFKLSVSHCVRVCVLCACVFLCVCVHVDLSVYRREVDLHVPIIGPILQLRFRLQVPI